MDTKEVTTKFVTMRLPMPIYNAIKEQAVSNSRSVSGEIVYILKKAIGPLIG